MLAANPGRVREIVPVDLPRDRDARDPRDRADSSRIAAQLRAPAGDLLMSRHARPRAIDDGAALATSPADAEAASDRARQRAQCWRRRLLPALGIVGAASLIWAALVYRASTSSRSSRRRRWPVVADAVRQASTCCWSTCCRPRSRRSCGFLLGNLAAIADRHRVRAQQDAGGGLLPGRGDGQHDPGRRQGADPGAAASATAWSRRSRSRR